MKESVTYQAIIREGRAEGRAEEARRVILMLGEKKFGAADAGVRALLEAMGEVEQLEELIAKVTDVGSWQELLAALPRRKGNGRRKGKS